MLVLLIDRTIAIIYHVVTFSAPWKVCVVGVNDVPPPQGTSFLEPRFRKRRNLATSTHFSLFVAIRSVSASLEREEEPEEKMPQTPLREERASMYSRLSASNSKKRHLNQEWRQVLRSEGDKEGIPVLSFFSSMQKVRTYNWEIGRKMRVAIPIYTNRKYNVQHRSSKLWFSFHTRPPSWM